MFRKLITVEWRVLQGQGPSALESQTSKMTKQWIAVEAAFTCGRSSENIARYVTRSMDSKYLLIFTQEDYRYLLCDSDSDFEEVRSSSRQCMLIFTSVSRSRRNPCRLKSSSKKAPSKGMLPIPTMLAWSRLSTTTQRCVPQLPASTRS